MPRRKPPAASQPAPAPPAVDPSADAEDPAGQQLADLAAPPERDEEIAAVWVPTDSIRPRPDNPRLNDANVERIAASIRALGWGAPIVCREANREVIIGHARLKAAQMLGYPRVPVRFLDIDAPTAKRLNVADNKIGEGSSWDETLLASILAELQQDGFVAPDFDLTGLGFDEQELDTLLNGAWSGSAGDGSGDGSTSGGGSSGSGPVLTTVIFKLNPADSVKATGLLRAALDGAGIGYTFSTKD